ncbi:MAG TPA: 4Fe-4S dicluster domain-containing protein [Thermodesulfovibrionales bacterium]|nr:4Fe-4S dicluster domain-containing protein [Thermodesulfovibrionales bacterium]
MMMSKGIQPWRRLIEVLQGLVILGLPFLKIDGESALRFDIPTLRLHVLGVSIWMEEFFIVLIALIFFTFLVILTTILFGRIWCGWLCPQTVIVDFTRFLDRADKKGAAHRALAYGAILGISIIIGANLIWYFVSPYEFIGRLFSQDLGRTISGFWIVLTMILFLNFAFLRHHFCSTVCPYARLQSVLYDSGTLLIAFDPGRKDECVNCMACVKTCPVGIDIRQGMNAACINCAECLDQCTKIMTRKERKSLIGYFWGFPGETGRILRGNVLLIGSLTAVALVSLLYLSSSRRALDMTVLPNYDFTPRMNENGGTLNSYLLSVENRGRRDLDLSIRVSAAGNGMKITPERLVLKAGDHRRITTYVSDANLGKNAGTKEIEISLVPVGDDTMKLSRKANFRIPGHK